jgi:1,4-alpha-glucan branching enzyme
LQNHDQVGNRPFGERISALAPSGAVRAALAIVLLAPAAPLLFMGEEWGASTPFLFFCDFEPDLARSVTAGRRVEFAGIAEFGDPSARSRIPDPGAPQTFLKSKLAWGETGMPEHRTWLNLYRDLLKTRRTIAPHFANVEITHHSLIGKTGARCAWRLGNSKTFMLDANLGASDLPGFDESAKGRIVFCTHGASYANGVAPAWSVRWSLDEEPLE